MAKKTQHVVPNSNGGWSVKKGGASKATQHFPTQKEAIVVGRTISKSQSAELIIHRKDGSIRESNSYACDPCPPRDKK